MKRIRINIFLFFILILFFSNIVPAQKKLKGAAVAAQRAEKAATVLEQFSELGADSVPLEVFRKAKGVAVFSDLTQINFLLNKTTSGKGVLSIQNDGGGGGGSRWSIPIFMNFGSFSYEFKFAGKRSFDIILFIMDDATIDRLKKDGVQPRKITGDKLAIGPVVRGKGADLVMEKASIIYYTMENGKLSGQEFQNDAFFSSVVIGIDNNLNKKVYGKKSQVIFGQTIDSPTVPENIDKFRQTIVESLTGK